MWPFTGLPLDVNETNNFVIFFLRNRRVKKNSQRNKSNAIKWCVKKEFQWMSYIFFGREKTFRSKELRLRCLQSFLARRREVRPWENGGRESFVKKKKKKKATHRTVHTRPSWLCFFFLVPMSLNLILFFNYFPFSFDQTFFGDIQVKLAHFSYYVQRHFPF